MFRNVYIIRSFSCLLLVVFALSITPKKYLHNVFARHSDNKVELTTDHPFQLTISGYNCDNDNLVAESNFINYPQVFDLPLHLSFSSFIIKDISFPVTSEVHSSLRGPPVSI